MRAVIYARYSAGKDQTSQSIEGQVRVCRAYIESQGWEYTGLFADEHITGRTDQRPQFQAMIRAAEARKFDALVVYSTDRFSRDRLHSITYKAKLRDLGIKICYAAEGITDTPEGILLESLMEGWAQYYSEELSRKVKRGMKETALKGKSTGGQRTFGYRTGPDQVLIIDEVEAQAVREAYKLRASGETIAEITRRLNAKGLKGAKGRPFTVNSVKYILTNRRYLGHFTFDDVEIPGGCPAIIDQETFDEVQSRHMKNKKFSPKNKEDFLLSGKLTCGTCGGPLSGRSGHGRSGQKYSYYICKNKCIKNISNKELENWVAGQTARFFSDEAEIDNLCRMLYYYQAEKNSPEVKFRDPNLRLSALNRKKENLVEIIADTGNRDLVTKLEEINEEIRLVEDEIAGIEKSRGPRFTEEGLRVMLRDFFNREDNNEQIIRSLVNEVILYPDHAVIIFNIQIDRGDQSSPLKRSEVFASHDPWWAKSYPGRTPGLIAGKLAIAIKKRP